MEISINIVDVGIEEVQNTGLSIASRAAVIMLYIFKIWKMFILAQTVDNDLSGNIMVNFDIYWTKWRQI